MTTSNLFDQGDPILSEAALQRLSHFEDCQGAIDQLFSEALKKKGPSAFDDFLTFANRFGNLSVYNSMLVMIQRPGASAVGTRKQWEAIGRHVLPDAVPIVILQPFGPVRFVFEALETEGKPLPSEEKNMLFATGSIPQKQYWKTIEAAEKYGVRVVETTQYGALMAGTAAGIKAFPEKIMPSEGIRFQVKLNANHDLQTRFATLAHELGHIYCGHLGAGPKGQWPGRFGISYEVRELEAEAVSWTVCQRNGVTSRSREDLGSLINEQAMEKVSMYAIYEAANRVESRTPPERK